MANIFSQDNPFNDLMSTIGDMAMISVAWTVCSIPVVTIGASTSAACEVARELQTGSSKGIFRSFWAAFKRRFPTNLALTAILALFWGLALFDLWYLSKQSGNTVAILYGVTLAVIGSLFAFILPLSGRSKLSVGEQIKQSVRLALMRPHIAFAVLLLDIWPIIVVLIAPQQTLMLIPLLWILVAAGASFYLQMMLVRKTFALE
ncbi:transferase [Bifidobacterium pseudocatenulatum]|uniref:YesL family protein n=1 Tax=Bifidobacterium pseudocatenulatum TaxID=28026 RepID=UPI000F75B507|nr:YesL family protein [Bifidobacterium pseudocatenulatum]AZN74054.1 transferase [Bifidobacterium pseudocatenulatum]